MIGVYIEVETGSIIWFWGRRIFRSLRAHFFCMPSRILEGGREALLLYLGFPEIRRLGFLSAVIIVSRV